MVTAYPDVVIKQFHKDVEFMVLACDGIWDCKTSDQVIQYYKQQLPKNGTALKDIHNCNHILVDDICPDTFEEMRQNEGIGSDNMTVIIVDFLANNGGCNAKVATATVKASVPSKGGNKYDKYVKK